MPRAVQNRCVVTSCSGCLQSGQRRLWSRLLSMQFLQKVWPQGVVTGSKNNLQKKNCLVRVCLYTECVLNLRERTARGGSAADCKNNRFKCFLQHTDLMQRGHSKSDTARTLRRLSLQWNVSPTTKHDTLWVFSSEEISDCYTISNHLVDVCGQGVVLTPAASIFLPHHHLFIFFSSWEEGHSLAEAKAALSTCIMLHFGALERHTAVSAKIINTFEHQREIIDVYSPRQLTWCASLLPLLSTSPPPGRIRPSWWVGPWEPLRLVMGQGCFRYSDSNCKMDGTSSGTTMPSVSRICHLNPCHKTSEWNKCTEITYEEEINTSRRKELCLHTSTRNHMEQLNLNRNCIYIHILWD